MQKKAKNESVIYSILRMSQKALMIVLCLIGVGYLGGLIAIVFDTELATPLAEFSQVFIPLFQLEIGVYGVGSTLENVQKIRAQIDEINGRTDGTSTNVNQDKESADENG